MIHATNERPTRRKMNHHSKHRTEVYVIELRADNIMLRPLGTRRGGRAEIAVTPGLVYQVFMDRRIGAELAAKRKARRQAR